DALGQDDEGLRALRRTQARGGELRNSGRIGTTTAGEKCLVDLSHGVDNKRLDGQAARRKIVGEVLHLRGALLHADRRAIELRYGSRAALLRHHEPLLVVEQDTGELHLEARLTAKRPCGVAHEQIDRSRQQRGKSLGGPEWDERHL